MMTPDQAVMLLKAFSMSTAEVCKALDGFGSKDRAFALERRCARELFKELAGRNPTKDELNQILEY